MAAPAPTTRPCHWCGETLAYQPGRGWSHLAGPYRQWCPDCHRRFACYPTANRCPYCGSKGVRDDHCAMPAGCERGETSETETVRRS